MSIYKFRKGFDKIPQISFKEVNISERKIQKTLKDKFEVIDEDCLIISEDYSFPEYKTNRSIDLLAIDKNANIVVIELKRDDSSHMELQALRYASMVANFIFGDAVKIYDEYLKKTGSEEEAETNLKEFLGWEDEEEQDFAVDTRIILISSDFSKELTTAVMWLNERDLNIECVRLIPYKYNDEVLINVKRIIPLEETKDYQVAKKEQSEQRRKVQQGSKDYTKYSFDGDNWHGKGKLVLHLIHDWFKKNKPKSIDELKEVFPPKDFKKSSEVNRISSLFLNEAEVKEIYKNRKVKRHFLEEEYVLKFQDGSRYVISNQWGTTFPPFLKEAKMLSYEIKERQS